MKKLILLLSAIAVLSACDVYINYNNPETPKNENNQQGQTPEKDPESDNPGQEQIFEKDDLYGTWKVTHAKYTEDAKMTEWEYEETRATFKENGLYIGEGYWGYGEGTYSINANTITVNISMSPFFKYEVLSLDNNIAELKITFVSTGVTVWVKCEKSVASEDDNEGEEDEDASTTISPANPFDSEDTAIAALSSAYIPLRDFLITQQVIEYNAVNDRDRINTTLISNAWRQAYLTIRRLNTVIDALSRVNSYDSAPSYVSHARAVRAFTYYNIVTLWGDVVYLDESNYNDMDYIYSPPKTSATTILMNEEASLKTAIDDMDGVSFGVNGFSSDAANILLAEISLHTGNNSSAEVYLNKVGKVGNTDTPIFQISLDGIAQNQASSGYFNKYKGKIWDEYTEYLAIYSHSTVDIYLKESQNDTENILEEWAKLPQYGYWAALVRLGKAEEVTGCQSSEILLPCPE